MMAMLQTLSDEHREILVLRELQQCSYEEISTMLKVPLGMVIECAFCIARVDGELRKRFSGYGS